VNAGTLRKIIVGVSSERNRGTHRLSVRSWTWFSGSESM
jgi:hypothetical protein